MLFLDEAAGKHADHICCNHEYCKCFAERHTMCVHSGHFPSLHSPFLKHPGTEKNKQHTGEHVEYIVITCSAGESDLSQFNELQALQLLPCILNNENYDLQTLK